MSACAGLTDACSSSNGQGTTDILCRYFILLLVLWVEREREESQSIILQNDKVQYFQS
ncbi:MAG: hypothetical protein MJE68_33150 [Proteobacteria bacterium]|nr:hypothetical protein [Pseudomonadota bacterium]